MHTRLRRFITPAVLIALAAAWGCQARLQSGAADAASARPVHATHVSRAAAPRDVPAHVQTAEYLWTPEERAEDKRTYTPYLTYAYAKYEQYGEVHRAGIKTVFYINPLMPEPGERYELPKVLNEPELQAKDCGGNTVRSYSGTSYLLEVRSARATAAVRDIVHDYMSMLQQENPGSGVPVDYLFVDNANEFYGVQPMPCNFNQDEWTRAVENALAQTGFPVVMNSLGTIPQNIPPRVKALHGRNIVGLMYEACFADRQWSAEQLAQILTLQNLRRLHKPAGPGFWCYVNGARGVGLAASVIPDRMFKYASFLLTYDPKYSVYQTAYDTQPSTFKVLPETQFVPLVPVKDSVNDISDLQAPGGAYVRQYQYCYYRKHLIGSCEIAVNPGSGQADVPNAGNYRHSATLSGGGVLDGGTMSFNGPATDDLAPGTAAILVQ